jgi:hypothetical protein
MTTNLNAKARHGSTVAGLGGLALAAVLLLCGAGNAPIENFTPQGAMQADLNAGGHSLTNALTVNATNVAATNLSATSATAGSLTATNVTVSGALTATNFTLPFGSVTSAPTTLAGYGIGDAYTKTAADARYSPLAGSTNLTTLGAVSAGTFPYANLAGNPVTVVGGKTLGVSNTLTLAGTDGSTLNVGGGGTLGSAAFSSSGSFLAPSAIGATVQGYNASTTTLGNSVNAPNGLLQADSNGLLIDAVLKAGAKTIYVSKSVGSDTRTGLSKYSLITPFATLTAAAAGAGAGDTIVAEDGVFTDKNLTLVTGVNWYFMPAATISITGAANNDTIFKDGGTAATVTIGGCGQTFSMTTTTSGTSIYGLTLSGNGTTLVVNAISIMVNNSTSTGNGTALASSCGVATVTINGNLFGFGGGTGTGYGFYISGAGGGQLTVNGNITGTATTNGYGVYVSGASTGGSVFCSQRILGTECAVTNSSTSGVSCRDLIDTNGTSIVNNHLTLYSPSLEVQPATGLTTGFNQGFWYGPVDQIIYLTPSAALASGTVTFPTDNSTHVGQRLTIVSTQTITALTVSVASGTIYGWSAGTMGPGSITFMKVAANVWTKL